MSYIQYKCSMSSPKISIIIPVFNSENFLSRCIDSVLQQTLRDWELILVDDGSPDSCGDICDYYANLDSRINVVHKRNEGVSIARNAGIECAKGEWIAFIDSDDYIAETFLADFGFDTYQQVDLYLQGYNIVRENLINEVHAFPVDRICQVSFDDYFLWGELRNILNSPVCKLFRRDIINRYRLRFDSSISFGEDHLFVLSYLYYASNVVVSSSASYNYVHHTGESLTRSVVPFRKIIYYASNAYKYQMELIQSMSKKTNNVMPALYWRTYSNLINTIKNLLALDNSGFSDYQLVLKQYKPLIKGYSRLRLHQKILQYLFVNLPAYLSYRLFVFYGFVLK